MIKKQYNRKIRDGILEDKLNKIAKTLFLL